jgi:hypothetical protein
MEDPAPAPNGPAADADADAVAAASAFDAEEERQRQILAAEEAMEQMMLAQEAAEAAAQQQEDDVWDDGDNNNNNDGDVNGDGDDNNNNEDDEGGLLQDQLAFDGVGPAVGGFNNKPRRLSYVQMSFMAAFGLVYYAYRSRQQWYLAIVFLTSSKWAYIVMGNALVATLMAIFQIFTNFFLNGLRLSEVEGIAGTWLKRIVHLHAIISQNHQKINF